MVELGTAGTSEHSAGVRLESHLVGLNGHRNGLLGDGGHESRGGTSLHISVRSRGGTSNRVASTTAGAGGASTRGVRVGRLSLNATVGGNPGEGIVHPTSVATVVGLVTGYELLLREGGQGTSLEEVGSLEGTGGGERPAGAALALVLHRGDGTCGNPIDGIRGGGKRLTVDIGGIAAQIRRAGGSKTDGILPLVAGQVRKLVKTKSVGVLGVGVVGLNVLHLLDEDLKALDELGTVLEVEGVLLHVLNEHDLDFS